jgi:ABC-2 type transport system ATP-binding protein
MGLVDRADDLVERYSTGMRQRLTIAKSFIHDPPLLLLDEPTSGLDPQAARNLRTLIKRLQQEFGKTIFLTTHNLGEAEELCDRVGILREGNLIATDTPDQLKRQVILEQVIELEVDSQLPDLVNDLKYLPGVVRIDLSQNGLVRLVGKKDEIALDLILQCVRRRGGRTNRVVIKEPSLEDVFFSSYS